MPLPKTLAIFISSLTLAGSLFAEPQLVGLFNHKKAVSGKAALKALNSKNGSPEGSWRFFDPKNHAKNDAVRIGPSFDGTGALHLDAGPVGLRQGFDLVAELEAPISLAQTPIVRFDAAVNRTVGPKSMYLSFYDSKDTPILTLALVEGGKLADGKQYARTLGYYIGDKDPATLKIADITPFPDSVQPRAPKFNFAAINAKGKTWKDLKRAQTNVTLALLPDGFFIKSDVFWPKGIALQPQSIPGLSQQGGAGDLASIRLHTGLDQVVAGWAFDNLIVTAKP